MKRRGLSTIVGATFFVIVMGSTIGYVTYSMDVIDDLAYQVDVKQDTNLNRQNEEFIIADVNFDGGEFNLTVTNTGTIPINITSMWAKNMTDPLWNQTRYKLNQIVSPGQSVENIGQGTGLVAMDSESYSLRLVTDRGNALETQVFSASNLPLEMTLVSSPINPLDEFDVTILYSVKNNLTNGAIVKSLTPQMATSGTATPTEIGSVTPASVQGLNPGETAFFEYTYEVSGNIDETVIFTASLTGGVPGNSVTDTISVGVAPFALEALESELSAAFGQVFLNHTSFEACEPSADDCTSDSSDWDRAWELKKGRDWQYRIEMRSTNDFDFYLDKRTSLMMLQAGDVGGSWDFGDTFYIIEANTPSDEGTNSYADFSESIPANGIAIVYFGAEKPSNTTLENIFSETGILAISVLIFASEDIGDDGYNGNDPRYSQNMPFQAISTF